MYRFEAAIALIAAITMPSALLFPHSAGTVAVSAAATPSPSPSPSPLPSPSPGPPPPVYLYGAGANGGGGGYAVGAASCGPVPPAPAVAGSFYPRIVIPSVRINVELHEGDGKAPPDHVWVAWHYPGMPEPGQWGNSYLYAHAHGSPPNSAPGLFWPLHYMHMCDAVYVYNSPTSVLRYQARNLNFKWPATDTRPFNQTNDERVTLQTCNGWGDYDPKTIIVAIRVDGNSVAPAPPPGGGGSGGGGGGGQPQPTPMPQPSPTPLPSIPVPVP